MPQGERLGEVLVGVAYDRDEGTSWGVPLEPGRCYAFGYAADTSAPRSVVTLWTPENRRADSIRTRPGIGVLRYCAAEGGIFRLEAKVAVGAGRFVVVGYRSGQGGVVPAIIAVAPAPTLAPAPVVASADPFEGVMLRQIALAAPGAARVGDLLQGAGTRAEWPVHLDAGKCYWLVAVGDARAVKALELKLSDPLKIQVADNKSDSEVSMVGYCASAPGTFRAEARVTRGGGEFELGVFAR
jgi:hypothetical protein